MQNYPKIYHVNFEEGLLLFPESDKNMIPDTSKGFDMCSLNTLLPSATDEELTSRLNFVLKKNTFKGAIFLDFYVFTSQNKQKHEEQW